MRLKLIISLAIALACSSIAQAQAIDQKDLKKSTQVPLLHRDRSAQQLYLRIMQQEDERALAEGYSQLLTSSHAGVRRRAALAFGRIGDKAAVGTLSEVLIDDSNAKVREYAAFALGEIEDIKGLRALISSFLNSGESPLVRARAAEALGKIAANPENIKIIEAETRERINNLLISALPKNPADLKPEQELFVTLAITALLRVRPISSIEPLAAQLSSPNAQIRFTAANSLARILAGNSDKLAANEKLAKTVLNSAIAALKDQSPLVRAKAAQILGTLKHSEAVEPLLAQLNDSDEQAQINVIRALGVLEDKRAAGPLAALGSQLLSRYREAKTPLSSELNRLYLIATSLGQIKDPATLPLLKAVRLLPNRTIGGNIETEQAIARFGTEAFFNFEASVAVTANDWQAAANFASGLGEVGGERALKTLDEMLAGKPFTLDLRALPELLRALVKANHPNSAAILREQLARAEDVIVRATAAELLGEGGRSDEDFNALAAALPKAINDKMNDARLAILGSIAKFSKAQVKELLAGALKDPDYLVRQQAADLLRMLGAGNFSSAIGSVKSNQSRDFYLNAFDRGNNGKQIFAELVTTKGKIKFELFTEDAPLTTNNFITLANKGYFNNVSFHRVVPNFVVQGGDPRGDGNGGPGHQIRCEINMRPYQRGAVGMALSGKDTGGSQFFICHSPQPHLDGGYTVFGQVVEGIEVVDRMVRGDRIESVTIVEK